MFGAFSGESSPAAYRPDFEKEYPRNPQEGEQMVQTSIHPGKPWLDTSGNRIQAHGGSLLHIDGTYYWYGENKEKTTGKSNIWHWGVRCYSSPDLYNWTDLGIIIEPDLSDPDSPLSPQAYMDRPHIIFNERTGKYVCWLKIMGRDGSQASTVLTADSITGPYEIVRTGLRPLGMDAGDFDLVVAPDGKAYYYFERVHSETICADLTDDYTNVTGYYSTHFPHPYPPFVREATAHFARNNKHYLITSGTTAYLPNPSEVAVADTWHGPFTVLGDPHPGDASRTSYHSQITSVFKVPGKKDLYIALADRWLPELQDLEYAEYSEAIRRGFESGDDPTAWENPIPELAVDDKNTSIADYVWLPLRFDGEMAIIDWLDEWKIEDYE